MAPDVTPILASLLVALSLAEPAGTAPAGSGLDVPYLPQTEALCGGAAVAMVFRYWGDRHADVQQFAPLVDREAGGIADDVLVEAIRQRRWQANRLTGSIETIRDRLARGQPLVLLLEDRPGRYHYVVAVGTDADHIIVHDPALGPSRRLAVDELLRAWKPSNFWALLVLPSDATSLSDSLGPSVGPAVGAGVPPSLAETSGELRRDDGGSGLHADAQCARLLTDAVDEIARRGLAAADEILGALRERCPDAAGPVAELAGLRFSEGRWRDAAILAEEAARRDPAYEYAWDVLGSSRFMENDVHGALSAWNRIGKPRLNAIDIHGLARTRYAVVAQTLALTPGTLLTTDQYRLAERRLHQLPARLSSRIGLKPGADGFATVNIAIVERPSRPRGALEWAAAGVQTVLDREVRATTAGWIGQGEAWDVSWRWWTGRPSVAVAFAAPRAGRLPGVWRVEASWEAQTYAAADSLAIREERTHGGITVTDWVSGNLRYEIGAGLDSWDGRRRAASIGGVLERRLLDDHLAVSGSMRVWAPLSAGRAFLSAGATARFRSSTEARGVVHLAQAALPHASDAAPLALWSGAGDGRARPTLLRAHALLGNGGVIDGPLFGRRTASISFETQRWLDRPSLPRVGIAAFIDAAHAARRLTNAAGSAFQIDSGVGLRIRLPGRDGTLRIDCGRGLRDGANQLTVGWQF